MIKRASTAKTAIGALFIYETILGWAKLK